MPSYVVYVWYGTLNVAVISTEDKNFLSLLIRLLPNEGYRVTVKKMRVEDLGPHDK